MQLLRHHGSNGEHVFGPMFLRLLLQCRELVSNAKQLRQRSVTSLPCSVLRLLLSLLGKYCVAGSSGPTNCPAGTYGSTANLGSSACECECFLRFVVPVHGFSRAWQARVRVPPDIFVRLHRHRQRTLYAELVRVSQAPVPWRSRSFTSFLLCFSGNYCPAASGSPTPCPAGTFGSTTTLSTSACACGLAVFALCFTVHRCTGSGPCSAGYSCAAGSTSTTQTICPTVCAESVAVVRLDSSSSFCRARTVRIPAAPQLLARLGACANQCLSSVCSFQDVRFDDWSEYVRLQWIMFGWVSVFCVCRGPG